MSIILAQSCNTGAFAGIEETVPVAKQRGRGVLHPHHRPGAGDRVGVGGDLPQQATHRHAGQIVPLV